MNEKDFVDLHVHDQFSYLDGAVKTDLLVELTAELGRQYLAQTNHGNMDGMVRFNKACIENGVKPIFGCELFFRKNLDNPKKREKHYHLTVQAKSMKGLQSIFRALSKAHTVWKGFRPYLPLDYPLEHFEDVLIMSGCASSPFWNLEEKSEGSKLLDRYVEKFKDDFYFEMMPLTDWSGQATTNRSAFEAAKRTGRKIVLTNDIHFLTKSDSELHQAILCVSTHGRWNSPDRFKFSTKQNHVRSLSEIILAMSDLGYDEDLIIPALMNTKEVAEKCYFKLAKIPVSLPPVLSGGVDEKKWIVQKCVSELERLGLDNKQYIARLDKELKAVFKGKFERYFLLVTDVVNWAKNNGILVGPARGSVAGSLAAFLLGITTVDPIRFGTIFERFISEGRVDLPDIDLDFQDDKRHLIEAYLKEKYGDQHVARVSTFGTMRGKQAIKDLGRVFDVPLKDVLGFNKCVLNRSEADTRSSFSILDTVEIFEEAKTFKRKYPRVVELAAKAEGMIKQVGVHAAGVVITDEDLTSGLRGYLCNRKDFTVINWDKEDLEHFGLMKLDVLGLNTLSVLSEAGRLVKEKKKIEIDYMAIPLDDEKTFEEISKGNTATCFQIGSKGLQKYCRELKADDFKTLCAASALYRPGCLKAGITTKYANCRLGLEQPEYYHAVHQKITEDTYGQIIYQEQIMYMLYDMAGIPWKTSDQVRKIISKSEGTEKWKEYSEMFADGCEKRKTLGRETALMLFDKLRFFGIYAFNFSISYCSTVTCVGGHEKRVDELIPGQDKLLCWEGSRLVETDLVAIHDHGSLPAVEVEFDDGYKLTCTVNHRLWTDDYYQSIEKILNGRLKVLAALQSPEYAYTYRRIMSFCPLQQTVRMCDLEVSNPAHNYILSNGIVSHNSHAVGYGLLSYWTAFMKSNHPDEWFCAYLNKGSIEGLESGSELTKEDECLREAKRFGIRILQPDINQSDTGWKIEGAGTLRAGLSDVRMCAEKANSSIALAKAAGGSFKTIHDFLKRVERRVVNKKVVKMLVYSGAMDCFLLEDTPIWKTAFDDLIDSVGSQKKTEELLLTMRPVVEAIKEEKRDQIFNQTQEAINYSIELDTFGKNRGLLSLLKRGLKIENISDIDDATKDLTMRYYAGVATSVKFGYRERVSAAASGDSTLGTKDALGGVYGNVQDDSGFIMAVYGPKVYSKHKELIENLKGKRILIRANHPMARKSTIFVDDIWLFDDVASGSVGELFPGKFVGQPSGSLGTEHQEQVKACVACKLREGCRSPVPTDQGQLNLMIVGEAPGDNEDREGVPFIGKAGSLLWQVLNEFGIERDWVSVTNTVRCKGPDNKLPSLTYVNTCQWLARDISILQPKFILSLGGAALYFFKRMTKGITEMNGQTEWHPKWNAWVTYCIHPMAALYDVEKLPAFQKACGEWAKIVKNLT